MKQGVVYSISFALVLFTACHKKEIPLVPAATAIFDSLPVSYPLTPIIKETSGIAASQTIPHALWIIEDSDNPPQLYLASETGAVQKKIYIKGATNIDWEDLACSGSDLYISDIGDNNLSAGEHVIYKFPEPSAATDTIYNFERIRFTYPDGAHNAEAILVNPTTKDIFIITKNDNPSALYKLSFPYATTTLNTATKESQLAFTGVVSAALSDDATEVLVKTYTDVYYYKNTAPNLAATLQSTPVKLGYKLEPQGEAITFAAGNSGFFTLSEQGFSTYVNLNFYKRK